MSATPTRAASREHYQRALMFGLQLPASVSNEPQTASHPRSLDELWSAILELRVQEAEDPNEAGWLAREEILLHYAPTAFATGYVLAPWLRIADSHTELGAALLDAFSGEVGQGESAHHPANRLRGELQACGLRVDEPASSAFCADARLCDADFAFALVLLESRSLLNALGIYAGMSLLGWPKVVRASLHDAKHSALEQSETEHRVRRCLEAYARQTIDAGTAVDWGEAWRGTEHWFAARSAWLRSLHAPRSGVTEAMLALVRAKIPHAQGYHRRVQLFGRSLDEWLHSDADAQAFLDQLAVSRYVVPGKPEQSLLVRASSEFGGTMFGTFTEPELDVIRRWITSLGHDSVESSATTVPAPELAFRGKPLEPINLPAHVIADVAPSSERRPWRELYLDLLTAPLLRDAEHVTQSALAHSACLLASSADAASSKKMSEYGLWPYSSERLWNWVDARHRTQVEERSLLVDRALHLLERKDVIWLLTQLAPAAFIDGAWLSGLTRPERLRSPSASLLFRIYRDELGAGLPEQHHGNVLRGTLTKAGIVLPRCDSPEFTDSARFVDEAFSLPTFWLAMARCSAQRFPELLGLNLAVEIAGLGAGYDKAATLLRKHALDPYFFVLHNSIDNPASGHTAWSTQAITLYMDDISAKGDHSETQRIWQRIWNGFESYEVASRPLLQAIALRLGPKLVSRGVLSAMTRFLPRPV